MPRLSDSPVGLALLVEACEALWLDEEAVVALRKLCESAPWHVREVQRIRALLEASGKLQEPSFALALAMAEGREHDAQEVARAGDPTAARSLYDIALERKDWSALSTAIDVLGVRAPREGAALLKAKNAV